MVADERIRVSARIRPLSQQERERGETAVVSVQDAHTVVVWGLPEDQIRSRESISGVELRSSRRNSFSGDSYQYASGPVVFGFDATFASPLNQDTTTLQAEVYDQIGRPVLRDSLEGISGCLFAYGISGSGKTHSLLGSATAPGVMPRLAVDLMEAKRRIEEGAEDESAGEEMNVRAAFLELYNENLVDLLADTREPLRLFENSREGVLVPGLSESEVRNTEEFAGLLAFASRGRSVGATGANLYSSRSHMLIQLRVHRTTRERTTRSKIHIIDLAGSERQKRARNEGTRLKEGIHINVSLSTLGLVISRLSEMAQGRQHRSVPFRDSKLTFLLKDSLSGNARTQVLIALSPASSSYEESLSTLRFAQSVKRIQTRAVADVIRAGAQDVRELQAKIERLKAELDAMRSGVWTGNYPAGSCALCRPGLASCGNDGAGTGSASRGRSPSGRVGGGGTGECDSQSFEVLRRFEGLYLSPTKRTIEVNSDGRVNFLGGGSHYPIRILPPAPLEDAGGEDADKGDIGKGAGARGGAVRLYSEGDPDYRYTLIAEEEDCLVWRHEDSTEDAEADVRWQRLSGIPSISEGSGSALAGTAAGAHIHRFDRPPLAPAAPVGSSLTDERVHEALHAVRTASSESKALRHVANAVPALARSLRPELALEAIEALISLCHDLDEANKAMERGGVDRPRLHATWLAPEANPEMPARELLHVHVFGAPSSSGREVWSLNEWARHLEALRDYRVNSVPGTPDDRTLKRRVERFWSVGSGAAGGTESEHARSPSPWHRGISPAPVPSCSSMTSLSSGTQPRRTAQSLSLLPRTGSPPRTVSPHRGSSPPSTRPSSQQPPNRSPSPGRELSAKRQSASPVRDSKRQTVPALNLAPSRQVGRQRSTQELRADHSSRGSGAGLMGDHHTHSRTTSSSKPTACVAPGNLLDSGPLLSAHPSPVRTVAGPALVPSLKGVYLSTSGVAIQVDTDGRVDFGGRSLRLSREEGKVLLRNPQDPDYGPYRLVAREASGVLKWEQDDVASEAEHVSTGSGAAPIIWTPLKPSFAEGSSGPSQMETSPRFSPGREQTPTRPPAIPGRHPMASPQSAGSATLSGTGGPPKTPPTSCRATPGSLINGRHSQPHQQPQQMQTAWAQFSQRPHSAEHLRECPRSQPQTPTQHSRDTLKLAPQYTRRCITDLGSSRGQSLRVAGGERSSASGSRQRSQSVVIASRPRLGTAAGTYDSSATKDTKAFDKNTLRLRNGGVFVDALMRWRSSQHCAPCAPTRRVVSGTCAVFVRKRPMFERDTKRCDFDILSVIQPRESDSAAATVAKPTAQAPTEVFAEAVARAAATSPDITGSVEGDGVASDTEQAPTDAQGPRQRSCAVGCEIVHHACMFDRSLVTPTLLHTQFPFDGVFDAGARNDDVYDVVARPLLETALGGNLATLFVFGQTGSGKTYTMRSIERMAAESLFERLGPGAQVSLTYFELAGRKALDLLTEQKSEIRLREEEDGCFRPHACEEPVLTCAEDLLHVMSEAATRRATESTTVNSASSRSHAVCRISILNGRRVLGRLLLVDCAGTERSRDTLYHKFQNAKESAEINSSLFALKDCIRFRQAAINRLGGSLPQDGVTLRLPSARATPLTKVLAESLVSPSAQLAVIATVSPNATDAEHTIETLKAVYTLSGRADSHVIEARQVLD